MFTGLIEEVGTVSAVQQNAGGSRITILARKMMENLQLGDSIAIDGVCTTVIAFDNQSFAIEASPETLDKTTFKRLKPGVLVNLERPLTPSSRIGGHYVTGHVDGTATLATRKQEGISHILTFELADNELAQYVVAKGSITIAGISLTVNTINQRRFTVAIIPHTMTHTNLDQVAIGDAVNIETDLLGKYVKKFLSPDFNDMNVSPIDEAFLAEHGFMPTNP
jgi:riboflavin synthase